LEDEVSGLVGEAFPGGAEIGDESAGGEIDGAGEEASELSAELGLDLLGELGIESGRRCGGGGWIGRDEAAEG
jgi:hypothetical protein